MKQLLVIVCMSMYWYSCTSGKNTQEVTSYSAVVTDWELNNLKGAVKEIRVTKDRNYVISTKKYFEYEGKSAAGKRGMLLGDLAFDRSGMYIKRKTTDSDSIGVVTHDVSSDNIKQYYYNQDDCTDKKKLQQSYKYPYNVINPYKIKCDHAYIYKVKKVKPRTQ